MLPVLVNATAGLAAHDPALLERRFRSLGIRADVKIARDGDHLLRLAEAAARSNPRAIVAGGGDGTISTVASVIAGSDIALGILPLGTLNHFARDLGLPLDLDGAVRVIATGTSTAVDLGDVNGRTFLNNSSLGLYPGIVRDREKQRSRGRQKWHALFWATMTALRRSPFLSVRLKVDGEEALRRTPFVFVGNNPYQMEGFAMGTRPRLDGGELSLYLTQRRSRWKLLGLGLRALFGQLRQVRDFEALTARTIRVETRHRRLVVALDGELAVMDAPLDYTVRPGALLVLVPSSHARATQEAA
jgi:diacylglycerol kinase family enzyme